MRDNLWKDIETRPWTGPTGVGMRVLLMGIGLAACSYDLETAAPRVDSLTPALVCNEQLTREITVHGDGFAPIPVDAVTTEPGLLLPEVTLHRSGALDGSAEAGASVGLEGAVRWIDRATLEFVVDPELALEEGVYDVAVRNADGQEGAGSAAFAAVSPPVASEVVPDLVCLAQGPVEVTVEGEGFLQLEGADPVVQFADLALDPDALGDCTELAGPVSGQRCTSLDVTLAQDALAAGVHEVTVTNPEPAGCVSTEPLVIEVVDAPVVDELTPPGTCIDVDEDIEVDIHGSGFLTVDGAVPTVTIGGVDLQPVVASGCDTPLLNADGTLCDTLTVTVPAGLLDLGDHPVVVTNPEPAACSAEGQGVFSVTGPPQIDSLEPPQVCDGGLGLESFLVHGENFSVASVVEVDGVAADTNWISDELLEAYVPAGLGPGLYDVAVINPGGCIDVASAALDVVEMPLIFFVDPPVVYQGVDLLATAFVAGIHDDVVDVWLEHAASGAAVPVSWQPWEPSQPSLLRFTVPAGLDEGSYHLHITDGVSCEPMLQDAVFVEGTLSLTLTGVEPAFGWTESATPTEIGATGTPPLVDLPTVYLSPTGGGAVAQRLTATTWQSDTLVDAVVPDGLPVGSYDVIVVNPGGEIGFLDAGFTVVEEAPPLIDSVAPGTLPNNADATVTITGAHFREPTVDLDCQSPDGTLAFEVLDLEITGWTEASIDATVPAFSDANLSAGAICVVVVTNDDGSNARHSAISITNPAQNLYPWKAGTDMTTPRRALVSVAGRATRTARYLYAIGGDDGLGAVWDTIERAPVGQFGGLGTWRELPLTLPTPLTRAGIARVDRFLYLVGGNDGASATTGVWRAQILDPLEAPVIATDLAVELGDGVGLDGGTYIYRVAAVFDGDFDANPDGESLPSDPLVVRLPDLLDKLQLTLMWSPVPGAEGYRLYRSDTGSGEEALLAEVSGTSFVDVGDPTDPSVRPLPPGALGQWAALPSLPSPLESMGVSVAVDPADPDTWHLYVGGGRDDAGTPSSAIHHLDLTVIDEHDHAAGSWTTSPLTLTNARYETGAVTLTSELHSRVPEGESWVYFLQGRTATQVVSTVDAYRPGPGGALVEGFNVFGSSTRAGHGVAHASNFIYVYGGGNGQPDASGDSAEVCTDSIAICTTGLHANVPNPPDVVNWNGLGLSMFEPRYLLGSAQESSVLFAVGGETGAGATTSVDYTNY